VTGPEQKALTLLREVKQQVDALRNALNTVDRVLDILDMKTLNLKTELVKSE